MAPGLIGILGLIGLLALIAYGVPIGVALAVVGVIGLLAVTGTTVTMALLTSFPYHEMAHWAWIVLPMFILLGNFALHAGVGQDIYKAAYYWLGRIRGGVALSVTGSCAAFAFASGSSLATAAMFTKLALPEMERYNYDKGFTCGCIAASGTLAALIPPSGIMVIFTIFTEVHLGRLLIAGIIPGLMTMVLFLGATFLTLKLKPNLAPPSTAAPFSLREKLASIKLVGPLTLIMAAILGGIYFGVFTPTEAGAAGAFVTFVILLVRRGFKLKVILDAALNAVAITAMIFLIVIGAMIFAKFLTLAGVITAIGGFLLSMPVPPLAILGTVLFLFLILGTFMEVVAIMALTLPIFFPVLIGLGFDGIWLGILTIMLMEIGVITPPLGTNVYVVKGAAGDAVSLEQIFRGILPYFLAYLVSVAIIVAFPQIALFLPGLMG